MQSLDRHREGRSLRSSAGLLPRMAWLLLTLLSTVLGGCASIVIHERPILDRTALQPGTGTTPSSSDAEALLEAGAALDKKHPDWAVTYYRDAALRALPEIPGQGVSSQLEIEAARGAGNVQAGDRVHPRDRASPVQGRERALDRGAGAGRDRCSGQALAV